MTIPSAMQRRMATVSKNITIALKVPWFPAVATVGPSGCDVYVDESVVNLKVVSGATRS